MVDKQEPQRDDAIAPASVTLNTQPQGSADSVSAPLWRQYPAAIAALAICVIALLAVVFYLPTVVTPVTGPKGAAATSQTEAPRREPAEITESPWQDAQIARARREAQAILQELLEQQEALEAIRVDLWAQDDFAAALSLAETADQHYQAREFAQAQALYEDSLKQMQALSERSEQVFTSALKAGNQAIEEGDQARAQEQFQLAGYIKADHEAVQAGLQRAAVLETVMAEIDLGRDLQRQRKLDEARKHYEKALRLDPQSQPAQEHLEKVKLAIADRDFGRHMSTGFAAMAANQYPEAIAAFEQALQTRPEAADAQSALTQAKNQSTQTHLQNLLQQAREHERSEEWRAAADRYQEALKMDSSLVDARVGSIRAGTRADIDENLEQILAAPERLTTPAVHRDFLQFYEETRRISEPGPRLERQLEELHQALQQAVQPVTVLFKSDNATEVTLFKVAELGAFDQRQLTLKPGSYTLVGSRPGYRDVRHSFTVKAGVQETPVVTIQCEEKINAG